MRATRVKRNAKRTLTNRYSFAVNDLFSLALAGDPAESSDDVDACGGFAFALPELRELIEGGIGPLDEDALRHLEASNDGIDASWPSPFLDALEDVDAFEASVTACGGDDDDDGTSWIPRWMIDRACFDDGRCAHWSPYDRVGVVNADS
jgi:hypothetical protein